MGRQFVWYGGHFLSTIRTQATFLAFVVTFCFKFGVFAWNSEMRPYNFPTALQSTNIGGSNGGLNFEIRPLGADLIEFEIAELSKKREFLSTFLPIPNPISGQPHHFKSYEVGPKGLDFDV